MGRRERSKGRRGERSAELLLLSRDYRHVQRLPCGREGPDIFATDQHAIMWVVEVKNRSVLPFTEVRAQAKRNAQKHQGRWMTMCHIPGTRSWLIERQGRRPTVWHEASGSQE